MMLKNLREDSCSVIYNTSRSSEVFSGFILKLFSQEKILLDVSVHLGFLHAIMSKIFLEGSAMMLLPSYVRELKVARTCPSINNKVKMEKIWTHRLEI